jgi:hypothetical protein
MAKLKTITIPAPDFEKGEYVYLVSDPEQNRLQLICVVDTPNGYMYQIGMENGELLEVYGIQLSKEPDGDILMGITSKNKKDE